MINHLNKMKLVFYLIVPAVFCVCGSVCGQDSAITDTTNIQEYDVIELVPEAIPVLTPTEAQAANEEALKEYDTWMADTRKQKNIQLIKSIVKSVILLLIVLFALKFILKICEKKGIRSHLKKIYKSPFCKVLYDTRFCRLDWIAMLLIFVVTFFSSLLIGQKAMLNGYIGTAYYPYFLAIPSIAFYNDAGIKLPDFKKGKLNDFILKGSNGLLEYSSITKEEAVPQNYGELVLTANTNVAAYYATPGLSWLVSRLWKLYGNPSWSTLYILFSIINGMIALSAYCLLRQVTGVIPSIILGSIFTFYPTTLYEGLFSPRDGTRAFFCFIGFTILLYLLRKGLRWKGTIICSIFLFLIYSLSTCFRNDHIMLIPFIVFATVFCHGKVLNNYKKKAVIIASIVLGIIVASSIPRYKDNHAISHVFYIGLADHPFMNHLHYSADNYTKGISYSDFFAWYVAAAKEYRDNKTINLISYTPEYESTLMNELFSLFQLYPYDFLRMALSSAIQSLNIGVRDADRKIHHITDVPPGDWLTSDLSADFYRSIPSWLYIPLILLMLLMFLGKGFYKNLIFPLAIVLMSGIYVLQYDIRHYFYFLIIFLLIIGFVLSKLMRSFFDLLINKKRFLKAVGYTYKHSLACFATLAGCAILLFGILFIAKVVQKYQIKKEIANLELAQTSKLNIKQQFNISKLRKDFVGTEVLFPEYFHSVLDKEDPKQTYFSDFLKIRFRVLDLKEDKPLYVYAKYLEDGFDSFPANPAWLIDRTRTCPIPFSFYVKDEVNTVYLPIYYVRTSSPLTGAVLVAEDNPIEVLSVERIVDQDKIHTRSAFLIPDSLDLMQYQGTIQWSKVFGI